MENPLFKIAFLNDQSTLEIRFTFLVVTCLDYHFVQSDLVGSGFMKTLIVLDFRSNWQPEKMDPCLIYMAFVVTTSVKLLLLCIILLTTSVKLLLLCIIQYLNIKIHFQLHS